MPEKIIEVTPEQASEIIDNRKPLGLFMLQDSETGSFVGIDNRGGDAWTEDFRTSRACKIWLRK